MAFPAAADLAVSANDHKVNLDNGTVKIVANRNEGTVSVFTIDGTQSRGREARLHGGDPALRHGHLLKLSDTG